MHRPYLTLVITLAAIIAFFSWTSQIDASFFVSPRFPAYFFGSLAVWIFYCFIEFSFGKSKSKPFEKNLMKALLTFVPALQLSIIAALASMDVETDLFRFFIGAIHTFIFGSIGLMVSDYLKRERSEGIETNPAKVSFEFMRKSGDSYEKITGPHKGPVFIQCHAKAPVSVVLLEAGKSGRPYSPHPSLKADSNLDLLYLKGEPFSLMPTPENGEYRLWIVGSTDRDQLMAFISAKELNWPTEPSQNFKTLKLT